MATILRLDSSARFTGSRSRQLGDHFQQLWLRHNPSDHFVLRDLAADPVGHIEETTITGFYTPAEQMDHRLRQATASSDALIAELQSADALLITVPVYNFSMPSALKAWIDQVVRIGQTFSYQDGSFTGLVTGKPAYVLCAYGAAGYLNGGPLAGVNFLEPYLRFLLGFLGFEDVRVFSLEGTTADEATVAAATTTAMDEITAAVASANSGVAA